MLLDQCLFLAKDWKEANKDYEQILKIERPKKIKIPKPTDDDLEKFGVIRAEDYYQTRNFDHVHTFRNINPMIIGA